MNCMIITKEPVPETILSKIKDFNKISEGKEACMAFDKVMDYWLIWQGGHDIVIYNRKGNVILSAKVGDRRQPDADTKIIHQWMTDRIKNVDYIDFR